MSDGSSARLTDQRVPVADGYYCDQKLRVGGILFLEEMTGKGFEEIADDVQAAMASQEDAKVNVSIVLRAMQPFLVTLMHQCSPDASIEELTGVINQLELDEFMAVFNKLKLFGDSGKNEDGPVARKKRTRQPVKTGKSTGPRSSPA